MEFIGVLTSLAIYLSQDTFWTKYSICTLRAPILNGDLVLLYNCKQSHWLNILINKQVCYHQMTYYN
ncbi:unnamed protein product [Schistosoma spindalis]|nr:unnamed protein product [Schistosoma spindale]